MFERYGPLPLNRIALLIVRLSYAIVCSEDEAFAAVPSRCARAHSDGEIVGGIENLPDVCDRFLLLCPMPNYTRLRFHSPDRLHK
jgi:hypothetical protein